MVQFGNSTLDDSLSDFIKTPKTPRTDNKEFDDMPWD